MQSLALKMLQSVHNIFFPHPSLNWTTIYTAYLGVGNGFVIMTAQLDGGSNRKAQHGAAHTVTRPYRETIWDGLIYITLTHLQAIGLNIFN